MSETNSTNSFDLELRKLIYDGDVVKVKKFVDENKSKLSLKDRPAAMLFEIALFEGKDEHVEIAEFLFPIVDKYTIYDIFPFDKEYDTVNYLYNNARRAYLKRSNFVHFIEKYFSSRISRD